MSQLPSMPVWISDFFSKTDHLSNEEQWAYLKLMMKTWVRNCKPISDDDSDIARLLNMGVKRWRSIRPRIAPFFDLSEATWRQPHLENLFREASSRKEKIVSSASLGGKAKSSKINQVTTADGSAAALPTKTKVIKKDSSVEESPPVSPKQGLLNVSRGKKHRLPPDWEPDEQNREYARNYGCDPDWLIGEFRDYWTDPDTRNALHSDWSRVWQRRCRDLYARQGSNGVARPRQDVGRSQGILAIARKLIAEQADD